VAVLGLAGWILMVLPSCKNTASKHFVTDAVQDFFIFRMPCLAVGLPKIDRLPSFLDVHGVKVGVIFLVFTT
jgi:hypothetical protein